MTYTDMENKSLETVCASKRVRIEAIHKNDADAMNRIIDEESIYINGSVKIYDRELYVKAVPTHELTYSSDLEPIATDHRVDGERRSFTFATCACGERGEPSGNSWRGSRRCCGTRRSGRARSVTE